jgi:uncharacterized protein YjbI with pentapeptide repeats
MKWTRGRVATTALSVALAGAAIVAMVLALWLLPPWLVDQAGPELEGAELTRAVTEERRIVLAGLVAIGAALTLWYTHQRQELDRDANRTDRYTKAVEQLGDDTKPSVQLGGVYALERVAKDSERDRAVSIEVLSAFVRQQSKSRVVGRRRHRDAERADTRDPTVDPAGAEPQPSEPVLAAFSVLARRPRTYPPPSLQRAYVWGANMTTANLADANLGGAILINAHLTQADLTGAQLTQADLIDADLAGANLTRAVLIDADLTRAKLEGANLIDADLRYAELTGASLFHACLTRANLARASLTGADLRGADLRGADLTGADLTGADLTGADLTSSNLNGANLNGAILTGANLNGADLTSQT